MIRLNTRDGAISNNCRRMLVGTMEQRQDGHGWTERFGVQEEAKGQRPSPALPPTLCTTYPPRASTRPLPAEIALTAYKDERRARQTGPGRGLSWE